MGSTIRASRTRPQSRTTERAQTSGRGIRLKQFKGFELFDGKSFYLSACDNLIEFCGRHNIDLQLPDGTDWTDLHQILMQRIRERFDCNFFSHHLSQYEQTYYMGKFYSVLTAISTGAEWSDNIMIKDMIAALRGYGVQEDFVRMMILSANVGMMNLGFGRMGEAEGYLEMSIENLDYCDEDDRPRLENEISDYLELDECIKLCNWSGGLQELNELISSAKIGDSKNDMTFQLERKILTIALEAISLASNGYTMTDYTVNIDPDEDLYWVASDVYGFTWTDDSIIQDLVCSTNDNIGNSLNESIYFVGHIESSNGDAEVKPVEGYERLQNWYLLFIKLQKICND